MTASEKTGTIFSQAVLALRTAWVVWRFECRRALGVGRLATVAALALFPVGLLGLVQYHGAHLERFDWAVTLFVLIPEVISLAGLLLWATPVIQAEVEGKTWTYLAVRPGGKVPILLGKYAAAVTWAMLTALLSLSLSIGIVAPADKLQEGWLTLAALTVLSCLTYGALYVLIGVIALRRGMIVAVAYTFLFEFLVGMVPAMVNQFTVQYHLRTLLVRWLHMIDGPAGLTTMIGAGPPWRHVVILLAATAVLLTMAAAMLRRRELMTAGE
jgi:ABC-type transport system involved in multi-copper enzyme maturation permease subunit